MSNAQTTQNAKLEVLAYLDHDTAGRPNTVYYSNILGKSAEEIQQRIDALVAEGRKEVRALTWDQYEAIEREESKARYNVNVPTIITREVFMDKLEVLPPCRWECDYHREAFFVSESITYDLYSFYARLGRGKDATYFEMNASRSLSYADFYAKCEALLASQAVAA